ncbi:50S ribosomal protein L24 [Candidatus Roizmanbacteria bacterium RIFCSPHIGHO2_02_FULL_40_13b]|uniref:Large ribosomal subunit protein uL24 n=1 Tax=Candidatus Roizmanbacteria bacterium RIFCSPHIGHO2_01_FULL_39_24 TaxID=1802032 RepID=A0A1F7GL58_9BACT|nr:MAG: 50S ribosomal protein L24 [Candidatus Roizmanbacteria bacterium RIFCSPHIGHO2_01_FULL_39_24]OGK27812.1 MAG: 50S ribosomal protein L24 [Candidatus Roizmanbacteria bacterium RIFCSPHIGHO2_02_FULL_40_13b]OGK49954.1 MAG: 50S ribosomal protein L24 [Candidatus Roizmanbacteria bacterium RIFCSPLOWO2_01_FULL_40_32]OGK55959.1 MAG: 50S ribosomal protein L24 [Candidatus Roizmanbacteria bacterium RIFCSPLOWO2_02_FULL_39_8]
MKFKKGDLVRVTAGKDKGREGKIDRVYATQRKVLVPDLNVYKKHVKKNEQAPQGGLVEIARPLAVGKIALVCPKCKKVTRIGYVLEGKTKSRICRKCKAKI